MEHPGGFAASPWAAMLGHGMHGMMQHEYAHGHAHASMPMDLHVPQAFPYYRAVREALTMNGLKINSFCTQNNVNTHALHNIKEQKINAFSFYGLSFLVLQGFMFEYAQKVLYRRRVML
ncbi:unnamed protein product [Leptidea sinapis]|uniref:Uncharacterized protein n=1 Tax=Leptidea sinapis TaxID=189913 RepID=A0A5E4QC89_9NEOP|nr:unnamed protein product [Leptidea sinapis]